MSSTTDNEQRFAYLLSPEFQIVNTAGKPLTGGWIEVYIHGTRVKYYCFSDFDGTLHPFQIPLDSLGSNIVLASPTHAYDIYIYNKFGSLVMSRYNVVPACNAADIVEDVVVIDSPDETINVTCDGGSNWHLEVNTDLIATASGLAEVSGALTEVSGALLNKKDKQEALSFEGAATKTVKNISQDDNGVITVEYEDIDLPQQVPNVNIISPSGTLDITSTTDPATNTKTFKIDVHKSNMDYFEGYYGRARYEDRPSDTVAAFTTYVDQWREYRYQGDFIANSWQDQDNTTFLLNSGLYLITASIRYKMTDASVKNKEEYIRIATGAFNGLENGTQLKDWSNEAALDENTIQLSFVRSVDDDEDYDNLRGNHTLYFAPYLPYGVNYAEIDHLQIVKLDSIVTYHGGPGPSYKPGYGIEIQDDVISIATGDVITNNYFETVVSSINNEINELTTVVNNVSGDITNLSESVTNLIGATGDYATKDYVDAAVSGLENYSAGQYISIEDHVISVTGLQPEGDYATRNELNEVIETVNNVTGDITNINEAITNIIGATGDYATEEYVDEAIAAVTGQPFEQQQSDWTQTDDTKVDYIKHKPRQVNLVAGDNISIEQDGLDVIISATGIPSLEGYATEQYVDEAVSGLENYEAGQYVSIQNHVINVTGVQPAGDYATEQYVDEAVAAVTGQPFQQVNSDWLATSGVQEILNKPDVFQLIAGDNIDITPSGNDLVISASSDVTKAYVDEQIDAVTGMIPEDTVTHTELNDAIDAATGMIPEAQVNADWLATSGKAEILNKPQEEAVEFEEVNLSDYALASAIPDVSNFVTQQDIDDSIAPVQSQVDTLAAATGDYITSLDGYATEQYVDDAVNTVTGMIPPIQSQIDELASATGDYLTEQVNTDWNATSGVSEILNKPETEAVEFEELNLSDYALASAIPDISDLATKTELANAIDAATGMIPDVSNFATKSELAAVEAEIPTLPSEEEVEFEELNLSDYALASAIPDISNLATKTEVDVKVDAVSGKLPTTELGKFTIHSNVSGGPIEVICPTDQAPDAVFYQIDSVSGNAIGYSYTTGVVNYYYGETPADFNGSDDAILFTINDNLANISSIVFYYTTGETGIGGPNLTTSAITGGDTGIVQSGDYKLKAQYNQAGTSSPYGKYLEIMFNWKNYASDAAQSLQWTQEALSKITFFGVVRPDPSLGSTVNLSRYYLSNDVNSSTLSYDLACQVTVDDITKQQKVYMPGYMPSSWQSNIAQAFEYGSNYNSPNTTNYGAKQYRAYKFTTSPVRYQFAYCTDWDYVNKLMTFVAYDNSGNAIEKWTLDYTTYASNVWTTEAIETGVEYTAGSGINITDDVISLDDPVNLVAGDNVNITVSGDDVVISASGGSNYTAGDGISIEDNTISVDETVITTEASGVYLPNSNFEIAPDGRAAIVECGTTTDYTPTWMSDAGNNVLSFATPITLIAGDTISFSHAGYPWVDIRINGTSVASEYTTGSRYTYTVESDILVSEIVIDLWNESDPPDPLRLNTVTIASNAVQRDEYVLMSELASAIETLPTPVQSDWNVTNTDNLAYIKNKPGNNRFVPNPPADYSYAGWILTNVGNGTTSWRPPTGSYSAGKGISLANNIISVNDTVITTAATAVNLPNANFEIDNDGQAYKVSTSSDITTTYTITPTSTGGTFDGTIKLKAGDTITITNCPVTNEYLYVTLRRSSETSFAQFYGSATAGSDINLTVLQDTDLTGTFNIAVREDMDFQSYSLTNSSCLIASVITSREEYALDSDLETKQNTLTGITDVQVVQALPVSPVSSVLYLIPEA